MAACAAVARRAAPGSCSCGGRWRDAPRHQHASPLEGARGCGHVAAAGSRPCIAQLMSPEAARCCAAARGAHLPIEILHSGGVKRLRRLRLRFGSVAWCRATPDECGQSMVQRCTQSCGRGWVSALGHASGVCTHNHATGRQCTRCARTCGGAARSAGGSAASTGPYAAIYLLPMRLRVTTRPPHPPGAPGHS